MNVMAKHCNMSNVIFLALTMEVLILVGIFDESMPVLAKDSDVKTGNGQNSVGNSGQMKIKEQQTTKKINYTTNSTEQLVLRVVTLKEPPFVEYHNITNGTLVLNNRTGPGVVIEILKEISGRLKAGLEFRESDDGQWGEQDPKTGAWSGMIGMLDRKEVDILAGAAIIRFDRDAVADQSYPFYTSETGMLIRTPGRFLENRFLIVTAPFQWKVWALTALTIFVSGCIMKALCRAMRVASEIQYTWSETVWMFFSVFVQQGLPVQPQSWTCRTMLAFWWLAALTLVATFTGNMVALFAVNKAALPFNTQDELVDHVKYDGYKIVTPNNTMTRIKFIRTSQLPAFQELWFEMSTKQKWINVTTLEDGIRLVRSQPKLVLLGPMETLQVYSASDCNVATTSNGIIPVMYSIMMQKGSPYRHRVSNITRQLVEMGLITKWMADYHLQMSAVRGNLCIFEEGVTAAGGAIDIWRAQGAFWILLAGAVMGSSGVLLEHTIRLLKLGLKSIGFSSTDKIRSQFHLHTDREGRLDVMGDRNEFGMATRNDHGHGRKQLEISDSSQSIRRMVSTSFDRSPPPESAKVYQPMGHAGSSLKKRRKVSDRKI